MIILGEPMIWDETCRIKHLPTRMYLAVKKRAKESGQSLIFDQYQVQFDTMHHAHNIMFNSLWENLSTLAVNISQYEFIRLQTAHNIQIVSSHTPGNITGYIQQNEFNYHAPYTLFIIVGGWANPL